MFEKVAFMGQKNKRAVKKHKTPQKPYKNQAK
jgi:hypothetical protein